MLTFVPRYTVQATPSAASGQGEIETSWIVHFSDFVVAKEMELTYKKLL